MLNEQAETLIVKLQAMLRECKNVQQFLDSDRQCFSQNEVLLAHESYQHKQAILAKISALSQEIALDLNHQPHHPTTSLMASIEQTTRHLTPVLRLSIDSLLNQLKDEISTCYRDLAINSNVVYENMRQLKDFWTQVAALRTDNNVVYDQKGQTSI